MRPALVSSPFPLAPSVRSKYCKPQESWGSADHQLWTQVPPPTVSLEKEVIIIHLLILEGRPLSDMLGTTLLWIWEVPDYRILAPLSGDTLKAEPMYKQQTH